MCGGKSQFKDKFGGRDVDHIIYSKSYLPVIDIAKKVYRKAHFKKSRILWKIKRKTQAIKNRISE